MDSDAEERQLKAAIQASAARGMEDKFGSSSSATAVTSRASSVGGRRTPAKKRESVGRRAAVIRSAESEYTLLQLGAFRCGGLELGVSESRKNVALTIRATSDAE